MPAKIETLRWIGDERGHLVLIDQTRLPVELVELECRESRPSGKRSSNSASAAHPAIGIAAAYGVSCWACQPAAANRRRRLSSSGSSEVTTYLATSRPTAVNLFWALDRMKAKAAVAPRN